MEYDQSDIATWYAKSMLVTYYEKETERMQDEATALQARITELEAQLAHTWQPVEDGVVKLENMSYIKLSDGGQTMDVHANWYGASVILPDNQRFCRQTYG